MFFSQTPGRPPSHITGRHVNTVSLRSVGARSQHTPFGVRDAVIGFVDQCLTRSGIADQGVGFDQNCAGFAGAKYEGIDVYV